MKKILASLLLTAGTVFAAVGVSQAQQPVAKTTESIMPDLTVKAFELDNGLKVFLLPNDSLPLVSVNMMMDVGSKNERPGLTGFAHLFEHLMFMGTDTVPDLDIVLENGGVYTNASTREDATDYYDVGPSNMLETMMVIDADRLATLGNCIDKTKLQRQIDVVLNERRQSYENQPYAKIWLKLPELMYPAATPYAHPVIGSVKDVSEATVDDVKEFFAKYYTASNTTLVVSGDFDVEKTEAMVRRIYGKLEKKPKAPEVEIPQYYKVQQHYYEMEDDVRMPKLMFFFHSPALMQPGDAEMDIFSAVMCKGKNSRLVKDLVYDKQLASSISCAQSSAASSIFVVDATPSKPEDIGKLKQEIINHFDQIKATGPTQSEFDRTKVDIETSYIRQLQSVAQRAENFNQYFFFTKKTDYPSGDLQRYQNATVQSLKSTIEKVLTPENQLVVLIRPKS